MLLDGWDVRNNLAAFKQRLFAATAVLFKRANSPDIGHFRRNVAAGCQPEVRMNSKWESFGSPVWTRFELSQLKMRPDRTGPSALRPMASAQDWHARPDWVPSRDCSRTRPSAAEMTAPARSTI